MLRPPEKPCPTARSYSYSSFVLVLDSFEYEYEEEDEDESEFPCLMLCSNWRRQRPDWNPIRETISIASGATITRKYLWGHDLAGWRSGQYDQEAGGIGGLLAISVATNTQAAVAYFPLTDGQGNIRHAVDGAGNVVATYDYDPFGTLIAESGPAKGVCPFRFSSKYYDSETGLLYFGYRFFDSRTAKWLSVDPLGEQGGLNLTAYCMNDPVNQNDPVGLAAVDLAAAWIWDRILGRGNRLSQVYRDKDAFENRIAEDAIKEMARKVTDVNTYQGNAPFTEIVDTARGLSASLASRGFGGTVKQVLPRVYHLATTDNLLSRESQTAATELTYELAILFSLPRAVGPRGAPLAANKVVPPPLPIQPPPLPGNLVPSGRLAGAGAGAESATTVFPKGYQGGPGAMWVNEGRGLWKLTTDGADKVMRHERFGKFFRSKSDGLWWVEDTAGHGGSAFKVYRETGKGLEWYRDADQFGDFFINKHKSDIGTFIPWKEMAGAQ